MGTSVFFSSGRRRAQSRANAGSASHQALLAPAGVTTAQPSSSFLPPGLRVGGLVVGTDGLVGVAFGRETTSTEPSAHVVTFGVSDKSLEDGDAQGSG